MLSRLGLEATRQEQPESVREEFPALVACPASASPELLFAPPTAESTLSDPAAPASLGSEADDPPSLAPPPVFALPPMFAPPPVLAPSAPAVFLPPVFDPPTAVAPGLGQCRHRGCPPSE